jgi:hypothetical protein
MNLEDSIRALPASHGSLFNITYLIAIGGIIINKLIIINK